MGLHQGPVKSHIRQFIERRWYYVSYLWDEIEKELLEAIEKDKVVSDGPVKVSNLAPSIGNNPINPAKSYNYGPVKSKDVFTKGLEPWNLPPTDSSFDPKYDTTNQIKPVSDGWIEIKEGCEMPDYDHHVLWLCENGYMHVEDLDKDGNPWLFEDYEKLGNKATHWRELPKPPHSQINQ